MPSSRPQPFLVALEGLTGRVRAYRTHRTMGRLAQSLARAADARARLEVAVDADVTRYVERVEQVHKKREDVFMKKHGELDLAVTDLAEFERDLEEFGKNEPAAYRGTSG